MRYELIGGTEHSNKHDESVLFNILNRRGIIDINAFMNPSLHMLHDPFLFRNMHIAVTQIKRAVAQNRIVIVYGDYDVDGTCATSIMCLGLCVISQNVKYYIPDRHKEGYGLNRNAIRMLSEKYPQVLLVTVDCGITSVEEVKFAKSLGMEVIVTDHHNPNGIIPDCTVIDAKVEGETYPFRELCGAGVALKIVEALIGKPFAFKLIDLAAIATIADIVPLTGENRVIVSEGLRFINKARRPGIEAIIQQIPVEHVESSDIAFKYAPMINSCGRLGNAMDAVDLLISKTVDAAIPIAQMIAELNQKRKDIESAIFNQAVTMLGDFSGNSIVLWDENWESGVIGIVASRLSEKYNRPAILFSYDKDKRIWTGSGRSIDGVNLFNLLCKCSSLISFGGHDAAAGMKVYGNMLQAFHDEFENVCSSLPDYTFDRIIKYDIKMKISDINKGFVYSLKDLQPCGEGNPEVNILLSDVSLKNVIIRSGRHFSASVFDDTGICDAICFDCAVPEKLDGIDMVVSVGLSKYRNTEKIQCQIISMMHNGKNIRKPPLSDSTSYGVRMVDQPIEVLGLNDKKIKQFMDAGIDSIQKLTNYLPTKYLDFRHTKYSRDINTPEISAIIGTVSRIKCNPKITYAMCKDEIGDTFMACWFHQDYVSRLLQQGSKYIFCGKVSRSDMGMPQVFPMYFGMNIDKYRTIIPEYKKIAGMSSEYLMQSIDRAIQMTVNTDFLDKDIVDDFGMLSDYDATIKLHHPKNDFDIRDGQRRKVFNELFEFNFILKSQNKSNTESNYILPKKDKLDELRSILPYKLTNDQENCINGLYQYMNSGKALNALVQGDVGAGKTMVALFSMLLAINNGHQACIIAPTEVLASQHYNEISVYMQKLGYTVGYLVGGMKAREKKALLKGLKEGDVNALVGTHAIIQKDVEFKDLAVAVVDEQHKFGVAQRKKLSDLKGTHMISMSATPIPRTLSMATYGDDIQVYSIKEKPAGRKDVITLKMFKDDDVNSFMLKQIRDGHQCYVVCPMIDDSDATSLSGVRSVSQEVQAMVDWFRKFPNVRISNVTGRMKKDDISDEIGKFIRNETNILISTTIIEVGVNVPNATVMVLKSSERFGLAQAHQLRGRVGRGNAQSYCILQTDLDDPKADILCETTDGFEIARQDLLLRGSGDYIGTQQTGNNKSVMLMMSEPDLYKRISDLNDSIYNDPAKFAKYSYILENLQEASS